MKEDKYDIESEFDDDKTKVKPDAEKSGLVVDFSKAKEEQVEGIPDDEILDWPGETEDSEDDFELSTVPEGAEAEDDAVTFESRKREEETEPEEGETYSKSVRKRIDRERRVTQRERQRGDRLEGRLERIERRLSKQTDDSEFEALKATTETKLADLKTRKKTALEEGETDNVVDIDDEMQNLKVELKAKELMRKEVSDVTDSEPTDLPPKAREWIDMHPDYDDDPKFRRAVLGADRVVSAQGYNVNKDEYYQEISKILVDRFPDYIDKEDLGEEKPTRRARKSPTGEVPRAGNAVGSDVANLRKGRVTLNAKDRRQMLRFGLDPTSKDDVQEFAKQRLITLRAEQLEG